MINRRGIEIRANNPPERKISYIFTLMIGLLLVSTMIFDSSPENMSVSRNPIPINLNLNNSNSKSNYELLESVFTHKLEEYAIHGQFLEHFIPSLQATYCAIYILDALDGFSDINTSSVIQFVLDHYDPVVGCFQDEYAKRYLDTNFKLKYYPLNTMLEVTCYGYLTLELLNATNQIDNDKIVEFIWSCFNIQEGGFIGQPYRNELKEKFKRSTLDNTFYALQVLNTLIDDWRLYSGQVMEIVNFISSLQISHEHHYFNGLIANDADDSFRSLDLYEPNLISTYYAVEILELFNSIEAISIEDLHHLLNEYYSDDGSFFPIAPFIPLSNFGDLLSTAIGMEIALKSGWHDVNMNKSMNYLLSNRNIHGIWGHSKDFSLFQLLDTFQIARAIKNSGAIDRLSMQDKGNLIEGLNLFSYSSRGGYSMMPKTAITLPTIHAICGAFSMNQRVPDLSLNYLYDLICNSFIDSEYFHPYFNVFPQEHIIVNLLRIHPIEFHNHGRHRYIPFTDMISSHKNAYFALQSLKYIFKQEEFANRVNMDELLTGILNSQYINETSPFHGGFVPCEIYHHYDNWHTENSIIFDNSYYAIKCLKLLSEEYDLGSFLNLSYNKALLFDYIMQNIVETEKYLYFQPRFANYTEGILENTFFMVDLLTDLNLYGLDTSKIRTFIEDHLNETNIRNLYYCFQISETLGFSLNVDYTLSQKTIENSFNENLCEFSHDFIPNAIDQDLFYKIVKLATTTPLDIQIDDIEHLHLGEVVSLRVSPQNMVLREFGPSTSVYWESPIIENSRFERASESVFLHNFLVPYDPEYFPNIEGKISVYCRGKIIGETTIHLETQLTEETHSHLTQLQDYISLEGNYTRHVSDDNAFINESEVYLEIYYEGNLLEKHPLGYKAADNYINFSYNYYYSHEGSYVFRVILTDCFYPHGKVIAQETKLIKNPKINDPSFSFRITGPLIAFTGVGLTGLISGGIYKGGNGINKRKLRKKKGMEKHHDQTHNQDDKTRREKIEIIQFWRK